MKKTYKKINSKVSSKYKSNRGKNMKYTIFLALAVLTFLTIVPFISADPNDFGTCPMGGGMMNGFYGGYETGFMIISWLIFILFIALIVSAIYWLIKSANKKK